MNEGSRRRKENLLERYRQSAGDCLCLRILEEKRARLFAAHEHLRQRMAGQKPDSKTHARVLAELLKTGNKLRAIKEVVNEIEKAYEMADRMITVEINGKPRFRLNANSDRRRSCHKKIRHTKESAEEVAREIAERKQEAFSAYPCRHCDAWHVGHTPA